MSQATPQNEPTMDEILASIRKIISEDQGDSDADKVEAAETQSEAPAITEVPDAVPEIEAAEEEVFEAEATAEPAALEEELAVTPDLEDTMELEPEPVDVSAEPEEAPPLESFAEPELESELAVEEISTVETVAAVEFGGADEPEDDVLASLHASEDLHDEPYAVETPADEGIFSASAREALNRALEQLDEEPEEIAVVAPDSGDSIEAVFTRAVQQSFEPTLRGWVEGNRDEIVRSLAPLIRDWMDENLPPLIEAAVAKEISRAVRSRKR
jgi:cell pole-organizing protein PopZ